MPSSACHCYPPGFHSFPTRRSSDLRPVRRLLRALDAVAAKPGQRSVRLGARAERAQVRLAGRARRLTAPGRRTRRQAPVAGWAGRDRSEEHTSELQSPMYHECRLLLVTATPQASTLSLHDALPICALFAGCCAHSMLSLRSPASAAFGLVLALRAHKLGWPVARGGSQRLADALVAKLQSLGGRVETDRKSTRLNSSHRCITNAVFCLSLLPPRLPLFPYTTLFRSAPCSPAVARTRCCRCEARPARRSAWCSR